MRNNKGFTLIEVLAVVVILISIIAIVTPKVIKQFSHAGEITRDEQINAIINISKIYMNQNLDKLPESGNYVLKFSELKQSGLMNKDQLLDPETREELTGCIVVSKVGNRYEYEYVESYGTCN